MRLLLLACLRAQTGNATTAARIRNHLHAAGHICVLKDAFMYESPTEIANLTSSDKFDAALAIHLYKGGRLLQGSRIPFGIIFGGTDVNEDVKCKEKRQVMGAVLEKARFAVAFTVEIKELAAAAWPDARKKIYVQSQGIKTTPSETFDWSRFLQNAGIPAATGRVHLFLLVCGLRRVKDPLYLVEAFSDWHRKDPSVHLGIIGPAVDPLFTSEVEERVKRAPGVHVLQELPQQELHAALRSCLALVNSSISEGMSAAILEAMDLEIPVLARDIPGNAAIVKHKETGLLFSTPQVRKPLGAFPPSCASGAACPPLQFRELVLGVSLAEGFCEPHLLLRRLHDQTLQEMLWALSFPLQECLQGNWCEPRWSSQENEPAVPDDTFSVTSAVSANGKYF